MPRKKVKVRDHKRRKPRKEDRIHVDEYERTVDLVVPKGSEKEFLGARTSFENRGARSQVQDLHMEAQETGFIDDKELVADWKRAPNQCDIVGVDDPTYGPVLQDLPTVRELLKVRLEGFRARSKEIVEKAKVEARKISKSKVPANEKKRKVAKVRENAKRAIKKAAKEDHEEFDRVRERVHQATKAAKKWSPERRKRANYVSETVGCSVIEADALIRRAHLKEVDYDKVDWDAMQGKDLAFDERIGRLERQVGKTYVEGEYAEELRAQEDAWNDLVSQRTSEVDDQVEYRRYVPEEYERVPEIY